MTPDAEHLRVLREMQDCEIGVYGGKGADYWLVTPERRAALTEAIQRWERDRPTEPGHMTREERREFDAMKPTTGKLYREAEVEARVTERLAGLREKVPQAIARGLCARDLNEWESIPDHWRDEYEREAEPIAAAVLALMQETGP